MGFMVVIPARYASSRLPGKPLLDIAGKAMIEHVIDRARESEAERIVVATDDPRIEKVVTDYACECCLTAKDHESGSDRIAEVIETLGISDKSILVNVQGDEPMVPARLINQVAQSLADSTQCVMSTAAHLIDKDLDNPNVVKLVMSHDNKALYFSRAPIPHYRDATQSKVAWKHIGIYAYRAGFLREYSQLPDSDLEYKECLEQLRVLQAGYAISVTKVDYDTGIGIDTQDDLNQVRELLNG